MEVADRTCEGVVQCCRSGRRVPSVEALRCAAGTASAPTIIRGSRGARNGNDADDADGAGTLEGFRAITRPPPAALAACLPVRLRAQTRALIFFSSPSAGAVWQELGPRPLPASFALIDRRHTSSASEMLVLHSRSPTLSCTHILYTRYRTAEYNMCGLPGFPVVSNGERALWNDLIAETQSGWRQTAEAWPDSPGVIRQTEN